MESNFLSSLQKVCEPTVIDPGTAQTDVSISLENLERYEASLNSYLATRVSPTTLDPTFWDTFANDLHRYHVTLFFSRVCYVRRENNEHFSSSWRDIRYAITPFVSALLEAIGEVNSYEFGVRLLPKMEVSPDLLMSEDEVINFARRFASILKAASITGYATELPRSREGDINAMALQLIDGSIRGETSQSAPVYALMAAALSFYQVQRVFMPRVSYGNLNWFLSVLARVVDYEGQR